MHRPALLWLLAAAFLALSSPAVAQSDDAPPSPPAASAEIDQTLINLPTTLELKSHKSYFRLTHRFARDLGQGSFGDLASDLFSLENGAVMGLGSETSPRVAGYAPGAATWNAGIEKLTHGHVLYLGFNLSRKF